MAYTDVWDVTVPLDTQAANQGAVDFRQTKLDIMQRVASFGAGILANRPTPETTSGTANWTGVMYWATDTNQCFMWSGTAWVDISGNLPSTGGARNILTGGQVTVPNDTSAHVVYTGTIPGGTIGAAGGFKFMYGWTGIGTSFEMVISFGGVVILDTAFSVNQAMASGFLVANGDATHQVGYYSDSSPHSFLFDPPNVNSAVDQTFSISAHKSVGTDTLQFNGLLIY
jgi:hypothetical protein